MNGYPIHPDVDYTLAPQLARRTLRQVETLFLDGEIGVQLLTAYLHVWSSTAPVLLNPGDGAAWREPPTDPRTLTFVALIRAASSPR